MRQFHLDHPRAGELIAVADRDAWFTYYYWTTDSRAPDFARTVDIHRKPGYDPVELFLDPEITYPKAKVGLKLIKKRLGLRYLMDVIPLDATLVHGSHGRLPSSRAEGPIFMTSQKQLLDRDALEATDVYSSILQHLMHDQSEVPRVLEGDPQHQFPA